jgi:hypothetical protein
LTDGNAGTFPPGAIFAWATDDVFDFIFCDSMVVNMRLASFRIAIEANIHS